MQRTLYMTETLGDAALILKVKAPKKHISLPVNIQTSLSRSRSQFPASEENSCSVTSMRFSQDEVWKPLTESIAGLQQKVQ